MNFEIDLGMNLASDAFVEVNYPEQISRQMPLYMKIDPRGKMVSVFSANFQIGGMPADIFNNLIYIVEIPSNTDARFFADFIEDELAEDIDEIINNFEEVYNGNNYVGNSQSDLLYLLERKIGKFVTTNDEIGVISPIDYFQNNVHRSLNDVIIEGIETIITSQTTDSELEDIAEILENDVCELITFDGTIIDMLIELRNDCEE